VWWKNIKGIGQLSERLETVRVQKPQVINQGALPQELNGRWRKAHQSGRSQSYIYYDQGT